MHVEIPEGGSRGIELFLKNWNPSSTSTTDCAAGMKTEYFLKRGWQNWDSKSASSVRGNDCSPHIQRTCQNADLHLCSIRR